MSSTNLTTKLANVSPAVLEVLASAPAVVVQKLVTKSVISQPTITAKTTTGTTAITLTAAEMLSGYVTLGGTPSGGFLLNTATAAALYEKLGYPASFDLTIVNTSGQTATITGSTNVTVYGGTVAIATAAAAVVKVVVTSATTAVAVVLANPPVAP